MTHGFTYPTGWWTFSEAMERSESAQRARNPCKHKQRAGAGTLSVLVKVLSGSQK